MLEHGITWVKKDEKREHLSVLNYKKEMRTQEVAELEHVVKEKQAQLEKLQRVVCKEKSDLKDIQTKKINLKKVEQVAVEKPIFNANKVLLDKSEFEDIKSLAQKQVVVEKRENELINTNKKLTLEVHHLKQENALQQQELEQLKSVKNQLNINKIILENEQLKAFKDKVMQFLDYFNLKERFNQFASKHKYIER